MLSSWTDWVGRARLNRRFSSRMSIKKTMAMSCGRPPPASMPFTSHWPHWRIRRKTAVIIETNAPTRVKVRSLFEWLAREPTTWLLVLDNADSSEVAREIEQLLPSAHVGTRDHHEPTDEVDACFSHPSRKRVEQHGGCRVSDATLALDRTTDEPEALSTALGGLPLALNRQRHTSTRRAFQSATISATENTQQILAGAARTWIDGLSS